MALVVVVFSIRIAVIGSNVSDSNCTEDNVHNHDSLWPEKRQDIHHHRGDGPLIC